MSDNLKERLADMSALSQSRTPADALKYIEELEEKVGVLRTEKHADAEWSKKMLAFDEHVTPGAGALATRPHVDPEAKLQAEEIDKTRRRADKWQSMVLDCGEYLKPGETPAERIEREINDCLALMKLLEKKQMRIQELERVCSEWAEVSQRNYQCAKRYHEALERIAMNQYGLQSIMEDYPDTDSVEYLQAALKYYTSLTNIYRKTAREAIAGTEGIEDVLRDFVQSQHRDAELDAIIEENIERLYEE